MEAVASLVEATQTKIIQDNEIKGDKEMQEAINRTIETEKSSSLQRMKNGRAIGLQR